MSYTLCPFYTFTFGSVQTNNLQCCLNSYYVYDISLMSKLLFGFIFRTIPGVFNMSNTCGICRKDATKRCVKCLSAWYCSRECQVADWKKHKKDCTLGKNQKMQMEDPTSLIQSLMDNHHITNKDTECFTSNKKVPIYKGNETSYIVCKIDGKGEGVIATRDIEYGELIAQERPIMRISSHQENEQSLMALFEPLSDIDKASVMGLHDAHAKGGVKSLLGIKQSNAFAKDANGYLSVLCPGLSKFNHSCLQNVDHVFVEPYQRVYAVRNIKKGDELCTAYVR